MCCQGSNGSSSPNRAWNATSNSRIALDRSRMMSSVVNCLFERSAMIKTAKDHMSSSKTKGVRGMYSM